jgi:GTP-binding protein HflX
MSDTPPKNPTRSLLVGAHFTLAERDEAASLLEELEELVRTLGAPIAGRLLVGQRAAQARFLVGSGKAEEISEQAKALGCGVIVFDNELTPSQQRNWEKLSGLAVIDRQEVILDIFARRAQTREARLQIDLARAEYSLPRLTRAWGHLVRQGGGIGGRGEGESQLEQDKRRLRGTIDRLRRELAEVKAARATQRKDRQRTPVPNVAIVGYTNAGKSSLLRRLTGADVLVEDKLFATLDTTTRRIDLPNRQPLLLTDTVGFVRRLPHRLVESFNATLEESVVADFLLHVLDASQPAVLDFYQTTVRVLEELGGTGKPTLVVFNKIDRIEDPAVLAHLRRHFPEAIFISAHTGAGLEGLIERLCDWAASHASLATLELPAADGRRLARLHGEAQVRSVEYRDDVVVVVALLPPKLRAEMADFIVAEPRRKKVTTPHSARDNFAITT